MPNNVEIKATLSDRDACLQRVQSLCGTPPTRILQTDTFFFCERGRLKLRTFEDGTGELIFYQRSDQAGPKNSSYVISPSHDPTSLRETLQQAYGVRAVVKKERLLLMSGRTRIHIDRVEDLGDFLELEVVLTDAETFSAGRQEAEQLMQQLGITEDALIEPAYVDLLELRNT